MAKHEDELLSHAYDGIHEFDNNLPRWWVWLFWGTIAFSIIYPAYYHFGSGLSQLDVLALEMQTANKATPAVVTEVTEADLLKHASSTAAIAVGKAVFAAKCMPCHGVAGQGVVGPNLTDDNWIHGGTLLEIRKVVIDGVPAKGMVPWKGLLTEREIEGVVAYIRSLRGTNPPGAKIPEGDRFVPES